MKDKSKKLTVLNLGVKPKQNTAGTTIVKQFVGGGGVGMAGVDLSDYLLKSVWDKAWEFRTDSNGVEYIFGKLPLVINGGITMYGLGDSVDIPSIYEGLPIDGTTIYWDGGVLKAQGGGSGGGITDITSSMVVSALGYTPANASDLTTLQSTVNDFLSGSDTDTIINKWKELEVFLSGLSESDNLATILGTKADKATTLAGYGIADAYTKSDVNTLLGDYVTLATAQTITGKKDFTTGGLFVNGKQIQYIPIDSDSGYWKLEGDLLVTGGITMFANEGTYTPSTIMDALMLDDATLGINANGELYVKGGTGGGLTEVHWGDVIGRPTLLSSFTDDVVAGKYLPLSGGTLNGAVANILTLKRNNTSGGAFVSYKSMNQDNFGWLVGSNIEYDFAFHYYKDNAVTNEMKAMITPEGNMFTKGGIVIGSVNKSDKVVTLNVLGKGWFSDGVRLSSDSNETYNTKGISFSATVSGEVLGLIAANKGGDIGLYPQNACIIRPGYDGTGTILGFRVEKTGSTLVDFDKNRVGLWIRQKSNIPAWIGYATNNQTNNVWFVGAEDDNVFRFRYSNDGAATDPFINIAINTNGKCYTRGGFNTELSTDGTIGYQQDGITMLRNNGAANGGVTILSSTGGVYVRPSGSTVTTNQTIFPVTGGLRVNDAPLATTDKPSIALPFSSYVSFGGFHALRGETNAVVLCAPVSASGSVILRPNGNASTKYQFSINNIGEAVLSSESAASLTINRTLANGGAYTRYNAAGQTTYGWISGSSANHTYQCQYYDGGGYAIKFNLDSSGNGLFYGGVTMYSDIRKKTKLQDVELSLSQIANAPLIEHYYNNDDKRTTHVGSIAQYWAEINDWFCKLDSEGYYTMEIQNAALASAISVARHLQKYETKTDRTIRKLKKRISELEEEMEKLKSA